MEKKQELKAFLESGIAGFRVKQKTGLDSIYCCRCCNKLKFVNGNSVWKRWETSDIMPIRICKSCNLQMIRDGYNSVRQYAEKRGYL
jgi:hypothetical protein